MCTLVLPIKPHLKKYILRKLQCEGEIVDLSFRDIIGFGIQVSGQLIKKSETYMSKDHDEVDKFVAELSGSSVDLKLKSYHGKYCGSYLNNDKIFYINKYLDWIFRLELFTFINTQMLYYPHIVITTAIDDFLALYCINEDDLPRQTAFKVYQRFKERYSYIGAKSKKSA
jgi:hypothetical protein